MKGDTPTIMLHIDICLNLNIYEAFAMVLSTLEEGGKMMPYQPTVP